MFCTSILLTLLTCFSYTEKMPRFQNINTTIKKTSQLIKIQDSSLQKSIERGTGIYADFCMQCHMEDGAGVTGTIPPLAKSDYLTKNTVASIKAVKYGLQGEIEVNGKLYQSAMPKPGLYDNEIADVMNYILNSWGNKSPQMITEEKVSTLKNK